MLLTCLCLFAVISAPGVFRAAIKRGRFEEALPFAVFAAMTVMYLFGLLGALRVGVYAVCRDHFDNWFMRLCVRPLHMEQSGDMRDYDYVWLCHPPMSFATEYGALFETPEDIGEHRLYQWTEAGKLRYCPFPT